MNIEENNDNCKTNINYHVIKKKNYTCNAESCNYARKIKTNNKK